jgi:hypothetical protein
MLEYRFRSRKEITPVRKYLYAVPLAAAALVVPTPAAQAHTATSRTAIEVLTISKLGGKPVMPGAVLKASLAKGAAVVISGGSRKLTCTRASFTMKVVTNPARPGTATLSVTSQTFARCSLNVSGVTVLQVFAPNLPYHLSASDAHGDPVTVSENSPPYPIKFDSQIHDGASIFSCDYTATKSLGHASNTHHTVTFSRQRFSKLIGNKRFCPAGPAFFSAKFGPIKDTSVSRSPVVYVN